MGDTNANPSCLYMLGFLHQSNLSNIAGLIEIASQENAKIIFQIPAFLAFFNLHLSRRNRERFTNSCL